MKRRFEKNWMALAAVAALTLAACGGGGSSNDDGPTATVITGVAATGAAFEGGTVQLIDSRGSVVGSSSTLGADGRFAITLAEGAVAPFVVVASRPAADGQTEQLTSVISDASQTVVNVTPVTTLIAALLSPSGNPADLAAALASGNVQLTPEAVAATVDKVQDVLAPLLTATGTAQTDPLTGSFSTDGTGYDRLLDSLHISIVPAATGANVEVAVKQAVDDTAGAQPTAVSFNTTASTPPALPAVDANTLVEAGTSTKIATFLAELTACYAVPFVDRVNNVTDPNVPVTGTAADVKADACKAVFSGNDPANYLSNGGRVGRTASNGGSFAGLFRPGATGVVFSQGSYEFTRGNGDIVIGYKSRDTLGNEAFDTLVLRKDGDGKLRLIGNQYQYPGSIVPYHQVRQFPTLEQSGYSYRSTGYTLNVDNRLNGSGNPIFDRVEVTTPRGNVLVLRPSAGLSFLGLVKGGSVLSTNYLRLRSEFVDPARSEDFATMEPNLFFAATPYTEEQMAAIPSQGAWTYRYFLTGNTGSTPDATQVYKTRSRALSIEELKQVRLSQFTDEVVASIQSNADASGRLPLPDDGPVDFGPPTNGQAWTVPEGALPATSITMFGRYGSLAFNDSVSFGSTARTALLPCGKASAADTHCDTQTGPGGFSVGAVGNGLHLFARDGRGREYANFYAMYPLVLP